MGVLIIISLLTITLTAFLGIGVMVGYVVYKDEIGFALPLILTIIITFMSSTLIAFWQRVTDANRAVPAAA